MSQFLHYKIEVLCVVAMATLMGCSPSHDVAKLEAIVPNKEINSVGMAGDQPADISR